MRLSDNSFDVDYIILCVYDNPLLLLMKILDSVFVTKHTCRAQDTRVLEKTCYFAEIFFKQIRNSYIVANLVTRLRAKAQCEVSRLKA